MSIMALRESWRAAWPDALAAWSRFAKLREPIWCMTDAEARAEGLRGSFAMIRLRDHAVVIGLEDVEKLGLGGFAAEILAHEIGHHVLAPADLTDAARLHARLRRGLPNREGFAAYVGNLYTDLLINDRLQRSYGLDIAGVYRVLRNAEADTLWTLYMRIYERLWGLPRGDLVPARDDVNLEIDADLGARLIRAYAKDWQRGAGRFAALLYKYLLALEPGTAKMVWLDATSIDAGNELPDGLAIVEDDEDDVMHPAMDPELSGIEAPPPKPNETQDGGRKNTYREVAAYTELMKGLGVTLSAEQIVTRYYRECALPHIVRFPSRASSRSMDPLPEGLDVWDIASNVANIDWTHSLARSPIVVPGVTTLERTYGETVGNEPKREPIDLYLGIDCSGSMHNPATQTSYPVIAGTVLALSALRARASVMVCLSGESPGSFTETNGFVRDEAPILRTLTAYLGTGYAFGVERLHDAFEVQKRATRPTHMVIVSDSDWFSMLDATAAGWDIAGRALIAAGGGGTCVLELPTPDIYEKPIARLRALGFEVYAVSSMQDVVAFAHAFARRMYEAP